MHKVSIEIQNQLSSSYISVMANIYARLKDTKYHAGEIDAVSYLLTNPFPSNCKRLWKTNDLTEHEVFSSELEYCFDRPKTMLESHKNSKDSERRAPGLPVTLTNGYDTYRFKGRLQHVMPWGWWLLLHTPASSSHSPRSPIRSDVRLRRGE